MVWSEKKYRIAIDDTENFATGIVLCASFVLKHTAVILLYVRVFQLYVKKNNSNKRALVLKWTALGLKWRALNFKRKNKIFPGTRNTNVPDFRRQETVTNGKCSECNKIQ